MVILQGEPAPKKDYIKTGARAVYYEVIRVIDGKLLFLEDHISRLSDSLTGANMAFPGETRLKENLKALTSLKTVPEGNIRIDAYADERGETVTACYFIPASYPTEAMYREGVKLGTFRYTRPEPGIKRWYDDYKSRVNSFIGENKLYDAVLINTSGEITEGSRSNIFFISADNTLITAPVSEVLPGITRKYILAICRKKNIRLQEQLLPIDQLAKMKGCFISGTSPKVLPVRSLDNISFNASHPLILTIMKKFDSELPFFLTAL